jgi:hypothetical protein
MTLGRMVAERVSAMRSLPCSVCAPLTRSGYAWLRAARVGAQILAAAHRGGAQERTCSRACPAGASGAPAAIMGAGQAGVHGKLPLQI